MIFSASYRYGTVKLPDFVFGFDRKSSWETLELQIFFNYGLFIMLGLFQIVDFFLRYVSFELFKFSNVGGSNVWMMTGTHRGRLFLFII